MVDDMKWRDRNVETPEVEEAGAPDSRESTGSDPAQEELQEELSGTRSQDAGFADQEPEAGKSGEGGPVDPELSATPESGEGPADEADALRAEVEQWRNKWLRAQADFDNFRRRTRTEKEELGQYANAKLVEELLPVLDNFALALAAGRQTSGTENLLKGIEMVYSQMTGILERAGLRPMDAVGSPFDPALHEAVGSEPSSEHDPGVVVEVLRAGYYLKEKVLRPAMVKISE